MSRPLLCPACGGQSFAHNDVLWPELVDEWRISPEEADYINRQQGTYCIACHNNLRSMCLSRAVARALGVPEPLAQELGSLPASTKVLEINESGRLTPILRRCSGYGFAAYPEIDMMNMPYADGSWDLVVHSDTLEHIADPLLALRECRRILKPGGACCFTVPVIVGRTTQSRTGQPPSYHGAPGTYADDYLVRTEFGADMWCWPMRSGFSRVVLDVIDFPAAVAITCRA
jgi:SAM-dependent methyltransferase